MDHYRIKATNFALRIRTNKHPAKVGMARAHMYANKVASPITDLEALIEWADPHTIKLLVDRIVELRKQHPNSVFKMEEVL